MLGAARKPPQPIPRCHGDAVVSGGLDERLVWSNGGKLSMTYLKR